MEYCNQCGELVEGRFCRMCGAPTVVAAAAQPAGAGYGRGYPAAGPEGVGDEATRMFAPAPGYRAESTQPIPQTPSEFDGFFRSEDGSPSPHAHTQLLAPVQADYRMDPPGGAHRPPEAPVYDEDDEDERPNRIVRYVTLGAVLLAAAIILGMLSMGGNQTPGGAAAAGTATGTPNPGATSTAGSNQIVLPTVSAGSIPSSSPNPSTSAPAAGSFSGDAFPLGPGSQGTWVSYVQRRLQQLGYYNGPISGTYDQATALAVQQFQAAAGVTGDAASTVGQSTLVALIAAGSTPSLHVGSRSSDVSRLDQALNTALGTHLQASSRYSAETMAEVMRYQSAVGLTPTGQVDAATWAKLQSGAL
jgi:peptidoglycan hydrolase-like protein with peptidoglycan-binding domain